MLILVLCLCGALNGSIEGVKYKGIVLQSQCVVEEKDRRNTGGTIVGVYLEERNSR